VIIFEHKSKYMVVAVGMRRPRRDFLYWLTPSLRRYVYSSVASVSGWIEFLILCVLVVLEQNLDLAIRKLRCWLYNLLGSRTALFFCV
jgi:hypothetical protein